MQVSVLRKPARPEAGGLSKRVACEVSVRSWMEAAGRECWHFLLDDLTF